ncbi:MAG: nucleotidyltransferase domain-containing protein [Acidilobaceae archaeon]
MLRERLREILRGTSAEDLLEPLEELLVRLIVKFKPVRILISGSLARRRFVRGLSDIDVLVIVDYDIPRDLRFELATVKDVDVEITVISEGELERALSEGRMFYVDAVKCGVEVYSGGQPLRE